MTMKTALQSAGFTDSQDAITEAATAARRAHPRNFDRAVEHLADRASADDRLALALLWPYLRTACAKALQATKPDLAVVSPAPAPAQPARAAPSTTGYAAVSALVRKSVLDTLLVDGVPIGDRTALEVRSWGVKNAVNARFAELLTSNLPLNEPVRKFRLGAEADMILAQARKEFTNV